MPQIRSSNAQAEGPDLIVVGKKGQPIPLGVTRSMAATRHSLNCYRKNACEESAIGWVLVRLRIRWAGSMLGLVLVQLRVQALVEV